MEHEEVRIRRGPRSGVPIVVAVHSTKLGQALGGCRLAAYPHWTDGLNDALRLSAAMTDKCAVAGLPNGGGKTVACLPAADVVRRDVLHDVGDVIESFGGSYATGPDVGTGPEDMVTIAERTPHVFCRPSEAGGSGDSSGHTADGVLAALKAVCEAVFGSSDLAGRSFAVIGLGRVGGRLLRDLAAADAELVATDVDPGKREAAESLGAVWAEPSKALRAEVDVVVPAALGGILTPDTVPLLRCVAIAGPANNQLDDSGTAELLHARGILWAPDYVVSAGGVIYATAVELHGESPQQATARVLGIGDTLGQILEDAATGGTTPASAARRLARARLIARTVPQEAVAYGIGKSGR
jgi:leucine dehydrogenase